MELFAIIGSTSRQVLKSNIGLMRKFETTIGKYQFVSTTDQECVDNDFAFVVRSRRYGLLLRFCHFGFVDDTIKRLASSIKYSKNIFASTSRIARCCQWWCAFVGNSGWLQGDPIMKVYLEE
jgi:hypothetical protein